MPRLQPLSGLRVADGDDERGGREQRAPDRAPARVVHQLEQEKVRKQQHEQSRVAVEDAYDVLTCGHRRRRLYTRFPHLGDENAPLIGLHSHSRSKKTPSRRPRLTGVDEEVISMPAARRPAKSTPKRPAHKTAPKRSTTRRSK